jgi:Uma2 family endonuclease
MSMPFEELLKSAEQANVRLELIRGIPVWEASPVFWHQFEVDRIRASVQALPGSRCACVHIADVIFRFSDGSFKRPDIAVLCSMPTLKEGFRALEIVPEAVVEIISEGYEYKDLVLSPSFYLENGVKDVMVLDPKTKVVLHHRAEWKEPIQLESPARIELECGCECIV